MAADQRPVEGNTTQRWVKKCLLEVAAIEASSDPSWESAMRFFRKTSRPSPLRPHEYVELEIPRWFDPSPNADAFHPDDVELGTRLWQYMSELQAEAFADVMEVVRPYIDALLPVAEKNEPTPPSPNLLAFHFSQGWWLAGLEEHEGLARNNQSSRAAMVALALLAGTSPGGTPSLSVHQFLAAGYYARRRFPISSPEGVARMVSIDATLSRADQMQQTWRDEQERRNESANEAGNAWLADRAAEKERRRLDWLARQTDDPNAP